MNITPVKLWRRQDKTSSDIGVRGKILLWTMIRVPSKYFMSQAPYPVIIVQLENGKKMTGQLVDWDAENLEIGQDVIAVLRKNISDDKEGVIPYVVKFCPV